MSAVSCEQMPHRLSAVLLLTGCLLSATSGCARGKDASQVTSFPAQPNAHSSVATQAISPALLGRWQVVDVIGDGTRSHELSNLLAPDKTGSLAVRQDNFQVYDSSDDRLIGRFLVATSTEITTDAPEAIRCSEPKAATATSIKLSNLAMSSLKWKRVISFDNQTALEETLQEMDEIPRRADSLVDLTQLHCTDGLFGSDFGQGAELPGAWVFFLPSGKLAMRWREDVVLLLKRLPEDAKPTPSFDCTKASSPVDTAICGSFTLSGMDQTLSTRYKKIIDGMTETYKDQQRHPKEHQLDRYPVELTDINQNKQEQRTWLKQRNACGADAACLEKSMRDRLDSFYFHPPETTEEKESE